jgi:hypothetical protein
MGVGEMGSETEKNVSKAFIKLARRYHKSFESVSKCKHLGKTLTCNKKF